MKDQSGLCGCGCGGRTKIAPRTHTSRGWVKGQPQPYLRGHAAWKDHGPKWIENENGCWIWQRSFNREGYPVGSFARFGARRTMLAYRALYEQMVGPIPEGLELDHLCVNPPCVNPAHLEPVTGRVNVHRSRRTKVQDSELPKVYAMRCEGWTWRAIGQELGVAHPPLIHRMRQFCDERGLPYPGDGHTRRRWRPPS